MPAFSAAPMAAGVRRSCSRMAVRMSSSRTEKQAQTVFAHVCVACLKTGQQRDTIRRAYFDAQKGLGLFGPGKIHAGGPKKTQAASRPCTMPA